jgi:hypothetical protein
MDINKDNTIVIHKSSLIMSESDFKFNDQECIKQLIFHIDSNILGRIPEIIRLYDHFEMIFSIIKQNGNILGQQCFELLGTEIDQLITIFNFSTEKLKSIILNNDSKQYDSYVKTIKKQHTTVTNFESFLNDIMISFKKDYIQIIEKTFNQKRIADKHSYYLENFRKMNIYINAIKIYSHNVDWIIQPSVKVIQPKHKTYLCASSVFGISQDEYKDLIDNDIVISVHNCSRRFNCKVSSNSMEMFIKECFKTAFPKIISDNNIELYATCPCKKTSGLLCNANICLDKLIFDTYSTPLTKVSENLHTSLISTFNLQLMETKKRLIKEIYGVDIYINCPKPDCPNGNGFPIRDILIELMNGNISKLNSPIHKCYLCNSIWCSKCGKTHPGRLCDNEDDKELGDAKRCPNCSLPIIRDGGCFHMNCTRCNVHWCWDCNYFTPQSNAYGHVCIKGNWINDPSIRV